MHTLSCMAQWDSYEATWEGNPGLMMVSMEQHKYAPYAELPYILVITQATLDCNEQGYPSEDFVEESELLIRTIDSALSEELYVQDVGRLLYRCSSRDYIYVADSTSTHHWIKQHMPGRFEFQIVHDSEWKLYRDFIYPDDYLLQTMVNGRLLKQIEGEGLRISDKTLLSHYASFPTIDELHDFRRFLIGSNYKIVEITEVEDDPLTHHIRFSRKDKLAVDKLSNTTLRLHRRALSLDGSYDGWEIALD